MSERQWKSREIIERIVVEGDLVLLTPTSLGNGDSDGLTDMSLLLDDVEEEKKALLTGTSIAGALRNYLRERWLNFGVSEESRYKDGNGRLKDASGKDIPLPTVTHLFGSVEDYGAQSLLIIDDALSSNPPSTELRDSVKIEGATRTAEEGKKFDFELLEAGTKFKLHFELLISEDKDKTGKSMFPSRDELLKALATALQGFEKGEIHLGARKRRGYGECEVKSWTVKRYNLKTKNGLLAWLGFDKAKLKTPLTDESNESQDKPIAEAVKVACGLAGDIQSDDNREYFEMTACFALNGSILIRSGSKLPNASEKGQPDTVHLRSNRNSESKAIVSGTSLAGVLRHRAVKICNTLKPENEGKFVENIFGVDMEKLKKRNDDNGTKEQPFASRLEVKESIIDENETNSLVQTRVKIDRFTGGAYDGALFDAAPVFAKSNEQALTLSLRLRNPSEAEMGLLLLLLKDLWTSDLPIGGESSIGRGRLKGISANLRKQKDGKEEWNISLDEKLAIDVANRKRLDDFVAVNLKAELGI